MHFDVALNLTWLLLGALALGITVRAEYTGTPAQSRVPKSLHIVGVALIVATLFPYISATDDVIRMERLNSQQDQSDPGKRTQSDHLIRLYETLDTPLVGHICQVVITLFFFTLVFTSLQTVVFRVAPLSAGRSPPFLFDLT